MAMSSLLTLKRKVISGYNLWERNDFDEKMTH